MKINRTNHFLDFTQRAKYKNKVSLPFAGLTAKTIQKVLGS